MLRPKFLFTALATILAVFLAPTTSQAGFTLTVSDGSNYGLIGGTTLDAAAVTSLSGYSSNNGVQTLVATNLTVADASGGFYTVMVTIATANLPGSQSGSYLTLENAEIYYTGSQPASGSLVISIGATGYTLPVSPVIATTTYSGNGPSSAPVTATFDSTINTNLPTNPINTITNTTATTSNISGSNSVTTAYNGSFGLQETLTLSNVGDLNNAFTSTGFSTEVIAATPAPPGVVMLVSALLFASLLRLCRRSNPVAAV